MAQKFRLISQHKNLSELIINFIYFDILKCSIQIYQKKKKLKFKIHFQSDELVFHPNMSTCFLFLFKNKFCHHYNKKYMYKYALDVFGPHYEIILNFGQNMIQTLNSKFSFNKKFFS